jgi:type VI secretion system secreted protein Hcp
MPVYLKYGNITGNVSAATFSKWIEIDSFSWGFSVSVQTTVGNTGNRLSAGKVTPSDLSLVKHQDDASVAIMKESIEGKLQTEATLVVVMQASADGGEKYMEYTMQNVICSSFQTSGSGGDFGESRPSESFTLNFSKIEFSQHTRDEKNVATPLRGGYDFTKAQKM